jgi:hypothetical protein
LTREEAHAQAEREVMEQARKGELQKMARAAGNAELEFALALLSTGIREVLRSMSTGRIHTRDLVKLGALAIEGLRECHLKHHNTGGGN